MHEDVSRSWWIAIARLTALGTLAGLAASRIGLVVHELVGHGGAALAMGGTVSDVQLFWFAGGWIRFEASGGELVIQLAGIAVETVIGIALWIGLRHGHSLGPRIARAIGAALVLHASWYLATGTWHGFGDGLLLHRALGDAKWLVAIPAALVTVAAGYAAARWVLGALAATIPGTRGRRILGTVLALAVAGGLQVGAALGEVAVRRDATYAQTMRREPERVAARELAQWAEAQRRAGAVPDEAARAQMQRQLAARHAQFPFAIVLAALTLLGVLAGALRGGDTVASPMAPGLLARWGLLCGGSIALVIAIDALFH